jgi:hypothetical protein
MKKMHAFKLAGSAMFILTAASSALAAEGFKLRFPISGTLGGEIVAPLPSEGWVGSLAITDVNVDGAMGPDGKAVQLKPTVPVPSTVDLSFKQRQTLANMTLVRLLSPDVQGGKLALAINIPYSLSSNADLKFSGDTPRAITAMGLGTAYQNALLTKGPLNSTNTSGLGDIETSLLWEKTVDNLKLLAGATLALPTGNYKYIAPTNFPTPDNGSSKPNIGYGNFYTVRTGLGMAYNASESVTLGARGSLGFNTQNSDSKVRSGNFYVLDLAAAFKTPVGVFGPHLTVMRQYTDDTGTGLNSALGTNTRVSLSGAGAFATFPIASIGAGLNLSYMKTIDARNSLSGSFVQARLSKAF